MEFKSTFRTNETGLFKSVPMDVYQAAPGESNSSLKKFMDSPRGYREWSVTRRSEPSSSFQEFSTLVHAALFEGRTGMFYTKPTTYGKEGKAWNGNANECKAWLAEHTDKPVLSAVDAIDLERTVDGLRRQRHVKRLLSNGTSELSVFARHEPSGLLLKGRLDWFGEDDQGLYIADLKKTQDASTAVFSREILNRGYHLQAAMYSYLLKRLGLGPVRFFFIAVEMGSTPRINVRKLTSQAVEYGLTQLESRIDKFIQCRRTDTWPEWIDDEEGDHIPAIDLPEYVYGDVDSLAGMTSATSE